MARHRRPPIDARTKWIVWHRSAGDQSHASCVVCGCEVSMPESIRRQTQMGPFQRTHPIAHFGHVKAWSRGGTHSSDNLAIVCPSCNMQMGATHMQQYMTEHMHVDTPLVEWMDTRDDGTVGGGRQVCMGACASRSWMPCKNTPLPGNVFCAVHISHRLAM